MTLAKLHLGQNIGKRKLTTLELLLIGAFALFLAYMSVEPLVLPEGATPTARPVVATAEPTASAHAATASADTAQPAAVQPQATTTEVTPPAAQQAVTTTGTVQPAAEPKASTSTAVGTTKPVFVVTANSTVLERIAPIAMVTIEEIAPPAATAEAAAVPAAPAPQETAKVDVDTAPAPAAAQPAPVVAEAPKQAAALRFEVSDATGVDGFATNVAQTLEQSGIAIAKVSSVPAGKQRRTVILFRDGFEEEAKRLSKLFVTAPALVNSAASKDSADAPDVKLVLGSAAAREKALLASDAGVPKLPLGRLARSN